MRGLVEDEEAWDRTVLLSEPLVESEMGQHVVADPILTATHSRQWHWSVESICDQAGQNVLSISYYRTVWIGGLFCNVPENGQDALIVERHRTLVDQGDLLSFLQQGSGTREGIAVECLSFPELPLKLAELASRFVQLCLL